MAHLLKDNGQTNEPPLTHDRDSYAAVLLEAEDFIPQANIGADDRSWQITVYGQGNYMVSSIGYSHVSGERLLSAAADVVDAQASAEFIVPKTGDYRIWSRFEHPPSHNTCFRVEVWQEGHLLASGLMGEKDALKYFYGVKPPVVQTDLGVGPEGLVEQSIDVRGLQVGSAEIRLVAVGQPQPAANRNIDFLYITSDIEDTWRATAGSDTIPSLRLYPILDAALDAIPPRYYLRITSAVNDSVTIDEIWNRRPWVQTEVLELELEAGSSSEWVPLVNQDTCHYTTLNIRSIRNGWLDLRVDIAVEPHDTSIIRTVLWRDEKSSECLVSLPPYPNKYQKENILTVEEQYQDVLSYLKTHSPMTRQRLTKPLTRCMGIPVWNSGRVGDAAAAVYHEIGMASFVGIEPVSYERDLSPIVNVAQQRFRQWQMQPNRSLAVVNPRRLFPTKDNIAMVKQVLDIAEASSYLDRFDYGDEVSLHECLMRHEPEDLLELFNEWQHRVWGERRYEDPNSSRDIACAAPEYYVESVKFYEDTAIRTVAEMATAIPREFGPNIYYGCNFSPGTIFYPDIATYIRWFREGAANFGRHSEFFWQAGQPGPLINGYMAEHFSAGMRYDPDAVSIQYTMPHSPGNTDVSFRRTAFTHLAHGARGLDFFGIGLNHSWTENYIDFRDPARYAAIRDINSAIATIEDILPESRPVPSKIALILSESTERWDFAGIAGDKAERNPWLNFQEVRTSYHLDRVGIYYALVHHSHPPDLLIEEDVQQGRLEGYDVAYWVGDCVEPQTLSAIQEWVQKGGRLLATAGAFRFNPYRQPQRDGLKLLGLSSANLTEHLRFFRPQLELPLVPPLDHVRHVTPAASTRVPLADKHMPTHNYGASSKAWQTAPMPALVLQDSITPADHAEVVGEFLDGSPAVIVHSLGAGQVVYMATLPGVAYLWSAYQPPPVPSRGPSSHATLTNFDAAAGQWILSAALGVFTNLDAHGAKIDARLLKSDVGYAIPLANYNLNTETPITLTIRGISNVQQIHSAVCGQLSLEHHEAGAVTVRFAPGVGDILRVESSSG